MQYADYAAWHRRLGGRAPSWRRRRSTGRETLAGAPELLELPTDHPRPARQDFAGASLKVELDEALTAALKTLSQRHGATLFMTLLAGWAAVLARLSGQDDVVIGTPSANRGHAEVEELIGFFVNTLPLRVDLSGAPSGGGAAGAGEGARAGGAAEPGHPASSRWWSGCSRRAAWRTRPLFQVMFAWQNAPEERLELPGLALGPLDPSDSGDSSPRVSAKFDLSLALWEDGGRIEGAVEYATALFERETVERWLGYLRRVLEGMVADERGSVERLELLPAAERRRVVEEWNATDAAFPAGACVHELFEAQAARTPDAMAVVWRRRDAELRGAGRARQPAGAPPAAPRRGPGRPRGHLPGAGPGAGRRAPGRAQGGRRLRAAGPGATRPSGWLTCSADCGRPRSCSPACRCRRGSPRPRRRGRLPRRRRERIEAESAQAPAAGVLRRTSWRTSSTPRAPPAGPRA